MARAKASIALLRANLPRYFPERHGVWARCEAALSDLCDGLGMSLFLPEGVATNASEARAMVEACAAKEVDFALLLHGGFTMGDVAREVTASPLPLGVWSVPEPLRTGDVQLNNFVSLNMTLSIARQMRDRRQTPVTWYHGAPEDDALIARLTKTLKAVRAKAALKGARIGRIGGLAPTFYNMEVSETALYTRLGVTLDERPMGELQARMAAIDTARAAAEIIAMSRAAPVRGVSEAQMTLTARCALALRDLAAEGEFDALAVSDWPDLQAEPGMHPGSAFSWLEEMDGLACTSEGDVLGAATQLAVASITGRPGAILDMTEPDLDSGRVLMWHGGGGPLYMADGDGAAWVNHPMIGREAPEGPNFGGVADFVFAPGPMSVLRIARDGGATFAMQTRVVAQDPSGFTGCRGWMEGVEMGGEALGIRDLIATVMAHGIEHHFVAVPGVHGAIFSEFGAWCGLEELGPRRDRGYLSLADYS